MTDNTRWIRAAGFSEQQIAKLDESEIDEFDLLCFTRYGPDQVTHSTAMEERWQQLKDKIA